MKSFRKIFFCTGARNYELLKEFTDDQLIFEYDERMASFKALGLAKATGAPVAICCTSGTAVAECIPALLEAFYSRIPLVLISGDRPAKMHGTGAPQTIHHSHLTEKIVGTYLEMTLEEFKTLETQDLVFPVHLNVLVDDSQPHTKQIQTNCSMDDFKAFAKSVSAPLFLFSHEVTSMRGFVEKFKETRLPFYAETLGQGRDLSTIDSERTLVRLFKEKKIDSVIRVGFTPLSKVWRLLEMDHLPTFSFDSRNLPALSHGSVAPMSSETLFASRDWWETLKKFSPLKIPPLQDLELLLKKYPHSEMSVLRNLQQILPQNAIVYLGNSLVIRFFELVQNKSFTIHGSRGVNGIDGQLATAIGLALGTQETVYCVLGDITTLYDLSSLREMPENLKLIIVNNSGGRIFDMLGLDSRIVLEHDQTFEKICYGFGLRYGKGDLSLLEKVSVLELLPTQAESRGFLKEWNA